LDQDMKKTSAEAAQAARILALASPKARDGALTALAENLADESKEL
jgi:gamma-glutamyl phosphate reductase